jgi:hypothetical protein
MRRRFLPFLLLPALWSCSTSDSNPIVDFGEGEGITYRTGQNLPVGPNDPSDWTSDATWNKQERALFADVNVDLNGPQRPQLVVVSPLFPNPSIGQATWFTGPRTTSPVTSLTVRAVLVNRQYQALRRVGPLALATGSPIYTSFDYLAAGLSPRELYRLYYVVTDASGLVYKGHGDVRLDPR